MLIGWELRGGALGGYRKSNCYLDWAREFVPDDDMVLAKTQIRSRVRSRHALSV